MSGFLTREQILAADDRPTTILEVPEWGGKIRLRNWTLATATKWTERLSEAAQNNAGLDGLFVYTIVNSVVNEEGELMFSEKDAKHLLEKAKAPAQRVFDAVQAMGKVDGETIEDSKKN